jgi:hypothetical protein
VLAEDDRELDDGDDKCWRPAVRGEEEASGRAGVVGGAVDELAIATQFSRDWPEGLLGYGQGVKGEHATAVTGLTGATRRRHNRLAQPASTCASQMLRLERCT